MHVEVIEFVRKTRGDLKKSRNENAFIWLICLAFVIVLLFITLLKVNTSFERMAFLFLVVFCILIAVVPIFLTLEFYKNQYTKTLRNLEKAEIILQKMNSETDTKKYDFGSGISKTLYYLNNNFLLFYYPNRLEVIFIDTSKIEKVIIRESPYEWNKQLYINVIHNTYQTSINSHLFFPELGPLSNYTNEVQDIIAFLKSKAQVIEEKKFS
ncbi:MAG: hypothetical protein ACOCXT_00045 [Candidatus Dojkabacteria bacterium]